MPPSFTLILLHIDDCQLFNFLFTSLTVRRANWLNALIEKATIFKAYSLSLNVSLLLSLALNMFVFALYLSMRRAVSLSLKLGFHLFVESIPFILTLNLYLCDLKW